MCRQPIRNFLGHNLPDPTHMRSALSGSVRTMGSFAWAINDNDVVLHRGARRPNPQREAGFSFRLKHLSLPSYQSLAEPRRLFVAAAYTATSITQFGRLSTSLQPYQHLCDAGGALYYVSAIHVGILQAIPDFCPSISTEQSPLASAWPIFDQGFRQNPARNNPCRSVERNENSESSEMACFFPQAFVASYERHVPSVTQAMHWRTASPVLETSSWRCTDLIPDVEGARVVRTPVHAEARLGPAGNRATYAGESLTGCALTQEFTGPCSRQYSASSVTCSVITWLIQHRRTTFCRDSTALVQSHPNSSY